jgi:hypothetical protein
MSRRGQLPAADPAVVDGVDLVDVVEGVEVVEDEDEAESWDAEPESGPLDDDE